MKGDDRRGSGGSAVVLVVEEGTVTVEGYLVALLNGLGSVSCSRLGERAVRSEISTLADS